jgi:hypothetical protein
MEKTEYKKELVVETISVLPRTLEIKQEAMKVGDVNAYMFVVYGYDPVPRKIWCATFIDQQEAEAWVHGSKVFGRPVLGAVCAGQGDIVVGGEAQKGAEMSDDAMAVGNEDTESAGKPS